MTWKLLREGEMARCKCGRRIFVQVGPGRVMWFGCLPNAAPLPAGVDIYNCKERACAGHRRYLGIGMPADQVVEPPQVAA